MSVCVCEGGGCRGVGGGERCRGGGVVQRFRAGSDQEATKTPWSNQRSARRPHLRPVPPYRPQVCPGVWGRGRGGGGVGVRPHKVFGKVAHKYSTQTRETSRVSGLSV